MADDDGAPCPRSVRWVVVEGYHRALEQTLARAERAEARVEALEAIVDAARRYGSHSFEVALLVNEAVAKTLAALAAAPNAPSDATSAAKSPAEGLGDDSSGCLTGTGWARKGEDDEA
jgi:hypothetical protein